MTTKKKGKPPAPSNGCRWIWCGDHWKPIRTEDKNNGQNVQEGDSEKR